MARQAALVALCAAMSAFCSCGERDTDVDYVAKIGSFERIDLNADVATFKYRHEKSGEHRTEEVRVDPETEVLINGRLSNLSDIRIGEPVTVHWRVRRLGGLLRVDALKIRIVRGADAPT